MGHKMNIVQAQSFIKRLFSSVRPRNALQHLKERALIQVKGPEVSEFLQGLITNDIHHLSDGVGSMFAMFLNTNGRILYDALIYKTEDKDLYMIECDSRAKAALQRHLKVYKVRRKVDILCLDDYRIHALFNGDVAQEKLGDGHLNGDYDKSLLPSNSSDVKVFKDLLIFKDPRVAQLGFRIISTCKENELNSLSRLLDCDNCDDYKRLRYSLGIAEGTDELPLGNSFPLECNCDYLHGVSFHKGCYIGQELTARTHHTGVIRKRLMPLFFTTTPTILPENNIILHDKVNLGKLRGIEGNVGLALLRISKALEFGSINIGNGEAIVRKPEWWPVEMPKEKLNMQPTI